ncbi:hypothetical protein [Nitrosomonas cryotolerans]|uniref:hypothetical protein n=1 Tax=Nitrosomonas cryotolerans TaxID=44575 RepID=UPI000B271B87|nr:hypothetical protein [Nitrosomonas cryotolerans]
MIKSNARSRNWVWNRNSPPKVYAGLYAAVHSDVIEKYQWSVQLNRINEANRQLENGLRVLSLSSYFDEELFRGIK